MASPDTSEAAADQPFHLQGNFAPVTEEVTAMDLEVVEGSIPPELCGLYARNGANPATGTSGHWFMGDGMLHGFASSRDGPRGTATATSRRRISRIPTSSEWWTEGPIGPCRRRTPA